MSSANSWVRSAEGDCGALILGEGHQTVGGKECGMQFWTDNVDQHALVGNEKLPFQADEHGNGAMKCGMT